MGTGGYTKEQEEFYQNMMEEIGGHEDFGKRNPVDIGIDCGYAEEDVMEMIRMIQMYQSDVQNDGVGEAEIYYFMLRKQKRRYIVSVNINDWSIEIVKELGEMEIDVNTYEIAYDTFVWTLEDNKKVIFWENFRTRESGKILLDFDLEGQILLLEDGVVVKKGSWGSDDEIIKLGFDRSVKSVKAPSRGLGHLLVGENRIYSILVSWGSGYIYSIGKDLEGEFQKECESDSSSNNLSEVSEQIELYEAGIDNGKPFAYTLYERWNDLKLFSLDTGKRTVKEILTLEGFQRTYRRLKYGCRDYTTEHYQLLGDNIYSKDNEKEPGGGFGFLGNDDSVCEFPRVNSHQGVAVYTKDIFIDIIGLEESDETAIIKIDMQNEREAVILPLQFSSK